MSLNERGCRIVTNTVIIFLSATRRGENVTNILNFYFYINKYTYPLAHVNKYLHKENYIYMT